MQTVLVMWIVAVAAVQVLWTLAPAVARRWLAQRLLAWGPLAQAQLPVPGAGWRQRLALAGRLRRWLMRHATPAGGGCGCAGCDVRPPPAGAGAPPSVPIRLMRRHTPDRHKG